MPESSLGLPTATCWLRPSERQGQVVPLGRKAQWWVLGAWDWGGPAVDLPP